MHWCLGMHLGPGMRQVGLTARPVARVTATGAVLAFVVAAVGGIAAPAQAGTTWPTLPKLAGFGSTTSAGSVGTVVNVTSLADSGPGSLRTALAGNNRMIKFAVAGTIQLTSQLVVRNQSRITIAGTTAPSPGVTLTGYGLTVRNSHDIVVQGIRVRNTVDDNLAVWDGSYNVVIDHCSLANAGDGNVDITENTHDVTVSWTLLGDTRPDSHQRHTKATLIANFSAAPVTRVSLHNNAWVNSFQRNPQVSTAGLVDIRDNLVGDWGYYGMRLRAGATGNIVNNYFASHTHAADAVVLERDFAPGDGTGAGPVFVSGNGGSAGVAVNSLSTKTRAYSVAAVSTTAATAVRSAVVAGSGVFPRDATDTDLISKINALP